MFIFFYVQIHSDYRTDLLLIKLIYSLAPCVSQNLVEELEKDRAKLQQELMAVRMKSAECSSLTSVIKNQERRMATLKIAQKVILQPVPNVVPSLIFSFNQSTLVQWETIN